MDLQKHEYVLDNAAGKITIEYMPFVNYALSVNGVSAFEKITLTNDDDHDWHDVTVEVSGTMLLQSVARIDRIVPHQTIDLVSEIEIRIDPQKLAELTEGIDSSFTIKISVDDKPVFEKSLPVNIQAYDQWIGSTIRPDLLASFVTPNYPLIAKVIGNARAALKRLTGTDSFDAYQSGDANKVRCQVAAIFEALRAEGLSYITAPAGFETFGQRVRLVDKVLDEKMGNCVDMSLLYASCLEAVGLNPILILTAGHCFAGCWLVMDSYTQSVGDDADFLLKATANGISDIVVMEATCLTGADNVTFEDSTIRAMQHLMKETEFECFIDIYQTRINHVRPIPLRVRHDDGSWHIVNDGADHDASAGKIKVLDRYDLSAYDKNPAEVTRYTVWERKLLDFSLRNTLLNIRSGRRVIPLLSFAIDRLEDFLSDGNKFSIRPFPLNSIPVPGERGMFESGAYPSVEQHVLDGLQQHRLYSFLQADDLDYSLKYVYRASRTSMEENGANNLYLVLGLLKWNEPEQPGKSFFAPLLLLPIEIVRTLGVGGYTIRARDEEVSLNITLVELLRQQHDIDLSVLNVLPIDEHGVDVKKILAIIREKIRDKKGWNVLDESLIGLFSFNKFVMWNDIHTNSSKLREHEIISSLVDGKLKIGADELQPIDVRSVDLEKKPAEYAIPLEVDSSQLEAIIASGEGKSFILHGPPGTGKSQTITNIIANALYQGKRVLFVAEKMAALEVVQTRLAKIGLAPFCLELHSNKATKQHFLHQLDEALNVVRSLDSTEYLEVSEKVFAERQEIIKYVEALHKTDASGFSLYDCIERYLAVADCPDAIEFDTDTLGSFTPQRLSEAVEMVSRMAPVMQIIGHPGKHPLRDLHILREFEEAERQIRQHVPETAKWAERFTALSKQFSEIWGFDAPDCSCGEDELRLFNNLLRAPMLSGQLVGLSLDPEKTDALLRAVEAAERACTDTEYITSRLSADYMGLDTLSLRTRWHEAEAKWFIPRYFSRKNFMRMLPPSKTAIRFADVPGIFDRIDSVNASNAIVTPQAKELSALFGDSFATKAKWQQMRESLDRTKALADFYVRDNGRHSLSDRKANTDKIIAALLRLDDAALKRAIDINEKLIEANRNINDHYSSYSGFISAVDSDLGALSQSWTKHLHLLKDWILFSKHLAMLTATVHCDCMPLLSAAEPISHTVDALKKGFYAAKIKTIIESDPALNYFNGLILEDIIKRYRELTTRLQELSKKAVYNRVASNLPSMSMLAFETSELGILKRNIKSGGRGKSIRSIIDMVPTLLPKLCPCMLMSPISVAQYISLDAPKFDLVIFDEASQMPTSEAVGAIARGKALIVVGDPKQMPPTSFFSTSSVGEDEAHIDDMESILDDCISMSIPSKYLTWHYRSRHESLISFSNHHYYDDRLTTFPSVDNLTSKVSFRHVKGIYDRSKTRSNQAEAKAVVDEVMRRLADERLSKQSIGIVAFSKVQQEKIEDLLTAELAKRPALEALAFNSREPIFVKNLENVQGDERDVILFSVGYGPDKTGKVSMNFGPLNNAGGERRLNVAVSRSRYEMIVFSSLMPEQIDLRRTNSLGVAGLKYFLEYASRGRLDASAYTPVARQHMVSSLCKSIDEAGFVYDVNVGNSSFKVDIAIKDPRDPQRYILGVLIDGVAYYATPTVRDREIVQPSVLRHLNWNLLRVWTVDHINHPERFKTELTAMLDRLLSEAPADPTDIPENREPEQESTDNTPAYNRAPATDPVVNDLCLEYPDAEYSQIGRLDSAEELWAHTDSLKAFLTEVIGREAPITDSLLYKRAVKAFGLNRVSPRVQAAVDNALGELNVFSQPDGTRGNVYWLQASVSEGFDKYRVNSGRDIGDVPSVEIENAMLYVLSQQVALDADDLKRLTANQLGYTRKGANIEAATTAVLDSLHSRNKLKIDSSKVMQI